MLYKFGTFELDTDLLEFRVSDKVRPLEPQVFDVLRHLVANADRVISRDELIDVVWAGRAISDASISSRINAARKALGDSGKQQALIKTVPRRGFRFLGNVAIANQTKDIFRGAIGLAGGADDARRIAGDLDVRYVLEGSVRRDGRRTRVTAQLVDGENSTHLWAESYDRKIDDVFDIQDEIVKEIITRLRLELSDGEHALTLSRGTSSVEAWQYCVQAMEFWLRLNASDHVGAGELAEKAVEIDPNYAAAWALLAWTHHMDWRLGLGGDSAATFERAAALAEKAMSLDDCNPYAIGISTSVVAASGRHDKGIEITSRGLDLLPGNADVRCYRSYALMNVARYEEAVENFRAALALNPLAPNWYLGGYARALLCLGRFDEALRITDQILAEEPSFYYAWLHRIFIYQKTALGPIAVLLIN